MAFKCPLQDKVAKPQEVLRYGIRETFLKYLEQYIQEHGLPWRIVQYEEHPELIGIQLIDESQDLVQPEEASEHIQVAVKAIGLDDLVLHYQGKLNWCYVTLIKPEWMVKYVVGDDYERVKRQLEECQEKLSQIKQIVWKDVGDQHG